MSDRIAKAVQVGEVRLGEGEHGTMPYVSTAECIDIQVVQVHEGRGALISE